MFMRPQIQNQPRTTPFARRFLSMSRILYALCILENIVKNTSRQNSNPIFEKKQCAVVD